MSHSSGHQRFGTSDDPASLTVLCFTSDPGRRIAAILSPFRDIAHEILVVADSRVSEDDLRGYSSVADRVILYDYAPPVERPLAWAHDQCAGRWVFRIDGDEVVSPDLIKALPSLCQESEVLQYWVPRRWLFPDARTWLDELPWHPDYQLRLVRNDPAVLSFRGLGHTSAEPRFPARWLTQPLYHLDSIVKPFADRLAKADAYEVELPGIVAHGGGRQNHVFYLPEMHSNRRLQELSAQDCEAVQLVLRAELEPMLAGPKPSQLEHFGRNEIDRFWSARDLPPDAYSAELAFVDCELRMFPAETRAIFIHVRNTGTAQWPWGDHFPAIRASYRWYDTDGVLIVPEGNRSSMPESVPPAHYTIVPLVVTAPSDPGLYDLEIDLVHEDVRWFQCARRGRFEIAMRQSPDQ